MPTNVSRDIYLWPDHYWCYNDEFSLEFGRNRTYIVLEAGNAEWFKFFRNAENDPYRLRIA